jgi:hypothetical protein
LEKEIVMPFKDPEKRREYQRKYNKKWYENNKDGHLTSTSSNRRRYRKQWLDFKATLSCTRCGAKHPAIIDFHHVIRDDTKQSVNRLAGDGRFAAAVEETKKCIPLCANCHRVLHWDEEQEKKAKRNAKRKKK